MAQYELVSCPSYGTIALLQMWQKKCARYTPKQNNMDKPILSICWWGPDTFQRVLMGRYSQWQSPRCGSEFIPKKCIILYNDWQKGCNPVVLFFHSLLNKLAQVVHSAGCNQNFNFVAIITYNKAV